MHQQSYNRQLKERCRHQVRPAVACLAALLFGVLLSGCGFHLRGAVQLPDNLKTVHLICPDVSSQYLCNQLRKQLEAASVAMTEIKDPSALGISVGVIKERRRAVSLSEDAGAAEYEVSRKVTAALTSPNQETPLSTRTFEQFQTYQYDDREVLGKVNEEEQIRKELDQLLARNILGLLATEARHD